MTWTVILYAASVMTTMLWIGWIAARFKGTLKVCPLPDTPPTLSTIVPARDEARNIYRCAAGLLRQDYPADKLELIFVDDASEDETPAILSEIAGRDVRARVVHTGGKPADWNGKQWACHVGGEAASGEWLCFLDADTLAEPDLLRRTVSFATTSGIDMLTLQPWYEMGSLWERIVMPALLIPFLGIFPPERINNPADAMAIANGQFILIRKEVYEAVGGHAAIRRRMMDDFPLSQRVKKAGFRLYMAYGGDVLRVRMYRSLNEIWASALKAAVDITGGWVSSITVLIVYAVVGLLPGILLAGAVVSKDNASVAVISSVVLFQAFFHSVFRVAAYRIPPWSGITYWIGTLISLIILVDGMLRTANGLEIRWKGRPVMR